MVVSESSKSRPDVRVRDWLRALAPEQQYVSALSLGEIAYGVERLPQGANKQRLQGWSRALRPFFANRILAADLAVADRWSAQRVVIGRSVSVIDSLIAATRGEYQGTGKTTHEEKNEGIVIPGWLALCLIILFLIWIHTGDTMFQRGGRVVVHTGLDLLRIVLSSSGGSSGGGGGGWSSSSGGFSGGGGSFGGGGASGDW